LTGLGIDTSGDVLSVALLRNDESYYAEMDAGLRHSERLMAVIDGLLAMAAAKPTDLDFVACLGGPGSFTGLRIGLSAAKGLSTALGIPLYTVPTLEAAAAARSSWPDTVLPLIDAKKNRWYTAAFKGGVRRCEDMDAGAEDIVRILKNTRSSVILVSGPMRPGRRISFRQRCPKRDSWSMRIFARAPPRNWSLSPGIDGLGRQGRRRERPGSNTFAKAKPRSPGTKKTGEADGGDSLEDLEPLEDTYGRAGSATPVQSGLFRTAASSRPSQRTRCRSLIPERGSVHHLLKRGVHAPVREPQPS
jgi:tRNA threonylcarbamoyladenosine biosynthesis protein TsaB